LYVINKKLFSIKLVLIYLDNGGVVETTVVDMVGKICWGSLEVFLLTLFCSPMLLTSGCGGTTPIMVTLFVARIKSLQQWIFKLQWIHQSWFDTNMFLRKCRWWLGGYFAIGCRLKITWWDDILSLLMPACAWLVVGVSRLHNTCSSLIRFLHLVGSHQILDWYLLSWSVTASRSFSLVYPFCRQYPCSSFSHAAILVMLYLGNLEWKK
jgi:hypothetical protein